MISIVICTYNRASQLRDTLAHVCALDVQGLEVETIVVDNNSTDDTAATIHAAAAGAPFPIRYIKELQQGKSFALNRALSDARGDVLALTDDDVWPARDWLRRIEAAFRRPSTLFTFGKVLPRWEDERDRPVLDRLKQDVWGPLALVDYGDAELAYEPEVAGLRLPIGANVALRRDAIVQIGGWRTDLGKVDNTLISGEDHDLFWRLRDRGLFHGVYDPLNVVRHLVPTWRTRPSYFRQWFYWNGKTEARMAEALFKDLDLSRAPLVAGAPRFLYRQLIEQVVRWGAVALRGGSPDAFVQQMRTIYWIGFLAQCWKWRLQRFRREPEVSTPGWALR